MERFGLAKYFDRICGATLDGSRDEKSKVIAYLLAETGSSNQATMVGDTAFDVLGAAAHGIPTVGVSWGYGEVSDMEKAGAKAIAHNISICDICPADMSHTTIYEAHLTVVTTIGKLATYREFYPAFAQLPTE
jgi:FMN phosphatase YigB (HAD superfamily)